MIDKKPINELLKNLKDSGRYRVFNDIIRERGDFPSAIWYGPYNIKKIVKIKEVHGSTTLIIIMKVVESIQ